MSDKKEPGYLNPLYVKKNEDGTATRLDEEIKQKRKQMQEEKRKNREENNG